MKSGTSLDPEHSMQSRRAVNREPLRIGFLLSSPSPHQVDLLNAVARRDDVHGFVGYVRSCNPARHWGRPTPDLQWDVLPLSVRQILRGELRGWFERNDADVWLLSSVYTSPATHLLAQILRSRRQPYAFLGEPPQPRSGVRARVRDLLLKAVLRGAAAVVGTGTEAARRYSKLTTSNQRVTSVPYIVDFSQQMRGPVLKPPAEGEPYRFVASAQLIHRKGIDTLIQACEHLPQEGWTLEIFGDGPLRADLERLAATTGRPITFRGLVPYEQKDSVFRGRHCFVFSTRWDGWGMVLPEALAMGLPVISTDQAMSAHDFIRDGVNGAVVPADDARCLAAAMRNAMDSRHNLPQQSRAARDSLSDYFPDRGADRLVRFLYEVSSRAA